jgi:hypothetical protein
MLVFDKSKRTNALNILEFFIKESENLKQESMKKLKCSSFEKDIGIFLYLANPHSPFEKGDSPYSPFFNSPFKRVNHPSRRVNGSLKRRFTL